MPKHADKIGSFWMGEEDTFLHGPRQRKPEDFRKTKEGKSIWIEDQDWARKRHLSWRVKLPKSSRIKIGTLEKEGNLGIQSFITPVKDIPDSWLKRMPKRLRRKIRIAKRRSDGYWQRYWVVKGKKVKNPITEIFLVKPEYMGGRKLTEEEQQKIFEERRAKDKPELTFVKHEEPEKMFIGKPKGKPLQVLRTLVHEDIHDMVSDIAGKKGSRWIDAVTVPTFSNESTGEVLNPNTAKTLAIQDEHGKYQNPIDVALKEMAPTVPIRYLSRDIQTSAARRKAIIEKMKLESKYPRLEGIAKLDRIAERMKITENMEDMRKLQREMGRTFRKYDLGTDIRHIL